MKIMKDNGLNFKASVTPIRLQFLLKYSCLLLESFHEQVSLTNIDGTNKVLSPLPLGEHYFAIT